MDDQNYERSNLAMERLLFVTTIFAIDSHFGTLF